MSNQEKMFVLVEALTKKATDLGLHTYRCDTKLNDDHNTVFEVSATFAYSEELSEQQNKRNTL
jgi:hypothetical protein